jgi:carbamate kinase
VTRDDSGDYHGVSAVIDKDFASAKLAELVKADALVILTAVDRVAINWGKPNQESLNEMTVAQAEQYCTEGHFAPGSMLPKVKAAISFAQTGGEAIIASLENAGKAVRGESGTKVHL